jgi:hypothetical protein
MIVLIAANAGGKPLSLNAGSVKGYCFATIEAAGPKFSVRKVWY